MKEADWYRTRLSFVSNICSVEFGTVNDCRSPCCREYQIAAQVLTVYCELEQSSYSANFMLSKEHRGPDLSALFWALKRGILSEYIFLI